MNQYLKAVGGIDLNQGQDKDCHRFRLACSEEPLMHRSSRLVSKAIVTAQSVTKTCPSISAAKDSAVERVQG